MATRPREIRSSAYSRSTALAWLLDISAAARAVLLLPDLARAVLLLLATATSDWAITRTAAESSRWRA